MSNKNAKLVTLRTVGNRSGSRNISQESEMKALIEITGYMNPEERTRTLQYLKRRD